MKTGNSRVNYRRLFLQVIRCLKLVVKAIRLEPWGLIIAHGDEDGLRHFLPITCRAKCFKGRACKLVKCA